MVNSYIPSRGDIIYVDFSPHSGHEQGGKRPALVLSPKSYNKAIGLVLVCPITTVQKGYIFEVPLPAHGKTKGVVLADHCKSMDWRSRNIVFLEQMPQSLPTAVVEKLTLLLPD